MEKVINFGYAMTDLAILQIVGTFIRHIRLQQNKTQQQVATAAGVNRSTIVQIEKGGGGTLLSVIQILRALEQLQLFQSFEIRQQISPLQLAKIDQQKRQRASSRKTDKREQPKSEW